MLKMKNWNPEDIRSFRKIHQLTRKSLSQLIGISIITIYKWEKGLINASKPVKLLLDRVEQDLKVVK